MKLTDEELKYYSHPKMQKLFWEMMGKEKPGDRYAIESLPGKWEVDLNDTFDGNWHHTLRERDFQGYNTILLPLPIDPDDDERIAKREKPRGLWGMVDWERWKLEGGIDVGRRYRAGIICLTERLGDRGGRISGLMIKNTPTLALLKALAAQWEVKI